MTQAVPDPLVLDVGAEEFEREVLERSREVGVVVDFWAPWCGPCRTLGPLLERLVEEHAGDLRLAKIDVDQAPELARRFAVRSVPTVLGVRDGKIVGEFEGAQPEAVVRRLLDALLPSEADRLARDGEAQAARGNAAAAESAFREALGIDARHPVALVGLARQLAERDEIVEALDFLERVSPTAALAPSAERLAAELRTRTAGSADLAALRARVDADESDLQGRLALGRGLASARQSEEALEELLEVVRRDPGFCDGAARKTMLDLFAVLGSEDPLTQRFRGALARALFR